MKRLVKILIVALLITGAGQVWALDIEIPNDMVFPPGTTFPVETKFPIDLNSTNYTTTETTVTFPQGLTIPAGRKYLDIFPDTNNILALDPSRKILTPAVLQHNITSLQGYIDANNFPQNNPARNDLAALQTAHNQINTGTAGQPYSPTGNQTNPNEKVLPECGYLDLGCYILRVVASIGWLLVQIFGKLADVANNIFNFAMNLSVREFSQYASIPGVKKAWSVCRDLVNISFIFILLYVAIGTILQLGSVNGKHLLKNVIIAALLVNFSFFFTSIVIDASNVTANAFYNLAARNVQTGKAEQGFFGAPDIISPITNAASNGMESHLVREFGGISFQDNLMNQFGAIIASYFGQIVLLMVTTTVLFAGAIMFLIRTIVLIFVLVLSPLAFLGMAVGGSGLGKIASKWKDALTNQVIFAPIYLLCIFLTIQMVTSTGGLRSLSDSGQGGSFAGSLLVFAIINGMMVGSLLVAKELGVAGAGMASGGLKSLKKLGTGALGGATFGMAGFAARNTLGRIGRAVADSERLKRGAVEGNMATRFLARTTLRASSGVAGSSFDARATDSGKALGLGKSWGKGGYDGEIKGAEEKKEKIAELLNPSKESENREKQDKEAKMRPLQKLVDDGKKTEKSRSDRMKEVEKEIETAKLDIQTSPDGPTKKAAIDRLKALESEQKTLQIQAEKFARAQATLEEMRQEQTSGQKRQSAYADQLEKEYDSSWKNILKTVITGSSKRTRKKQANAVRSNAKKTKEQKEAEKLSKKLEKILKDSDDKEKGGNKEEKSDEPKKS